MKWQLLRLFLPLIIIGFIVPMIMPGPDGKPLMGWRDWLPATNSLDNSLDTLENTLRGVTGVLDSANQQSSAAGLFEEKRLYQWQDTQGQWHFSDAPNPAAAATASKPLPEIKNIIQPVMIPDGGDDAGNSNTGASHFSPTTVSVEQIPQMIDDALNIKKLSEQYARQLEEL